MPDRTSRLAPSLFERRRLLAALCWAAVALTGGALAQAHEIGTTRVSVLFQQGRTYRIEIVTDAVTLAEKVAASTGTALPIEPKPAQLQTALTNADASFRRRTKVAFDDVEVTPAIAFWVSEADASRNAVATIELRGQVPPGASGFTWKYDWTFASYALTIRKDSPGAAATEWLEGGQRSVPFSLTAGEPSPTRLAVAWRYLTLGFTHIVPLGLDHMLFVLGIYLAAGRGRSVLWQVSAFTVAHSITLGLSMYGIVALSSRIVEPLIAVSIAYIAIENIFLSELKAWRPAAVFGFGLLHGLGFAGALRELGLPRTEFVTALFTFNVGVEIGQLTVIGGAFALVGWYCARRDWYQRRVVVPASALIAFIAIYWTVGRISL
jgi:hypothetical protein